MASGHILMDHHKTSVGGGGKFSESVAFVFSFINLWGFFGVASWYLGLAGGICEKRLDLFVFEGDTNALSRSWKWHYYPCAEPKLECSLEALSSKQGYNPYNDNNVYLALWILVITLWPLLCAWSVWVARHLLRTGKAKHQNVLLSSAYTKTWWVN